METQPGRILVVDDHKTNRLKMSFAVKKEGHEVETAENGLEAMEMLLATAIRPRPAGHHDARDGWLRSVRADEE